MTTFFDLLQESFAQHAARPACSKSVMTPRYYAVQGFAISSAAKLQIHGVQKGDRVALCTSNKRAFLANHLGVLFAGGVVLPLNPGFTREELRFFLGDSGATIAIVDEALKPLFE